MVGYVLGPFIFAACMFGMVTQLGIIVGEKESGLVTSMRHMGLLQSSYWAAWVVFDTLMALATALSIVVWGEASKPKGLLQAAATPPAGNQAASVDGVQCWSSDSCMLACPAPVFVAVLNIVWAEVP